MTDGVFRDNTYRGTSPGSAEDDSRRGRASRVRLPVVHTQMPEDAHRGCAAGDRCCPGVGRRARRVRAGCARCCGRAPAAVSSSVGTVLASRWPSCRGGQCRRRARRSRSCKRPRCCGRWRWPPPTRPMLLAFVQLQAGGAGNWSGRASPRPRHVGPTRWWSSPRPTTTLWPMPCCCRTPLCTRWRG